MSQNTPPNLPPEAHGPTGPGVMATPLRPFDPPKIGDFWLDARLVAGPSGVTYVGHDEHQTPVMLLVLSDGAAQDSAARDRLAGEVNKLHIDTVIARGGHGQDQGRLGGKFRSEDDDPVGPADAPLAPWVALAYDGSPAAVAEANRLLAAVDLSRTPLVGKVSGPDFALHWRDNQAPGTARLWPLPWPGRHDRAGWISVLVAWLLTLAMTALALLVTVLIFSKPPEGGGGGDSSNEQSQSQSGSPTSGSPSSGSPSQSGSESGSPQESSPGDDGSPSKQASMETPDPSGSNSGQPTPNRRLYLGER